MEKTKKIKFIKANSPWRKHKYALLLLCPALVAVFIFSYLPMAGLIIAFKDFDVMSGIFDSPWVGLQNFKTIFAQPEMLRAVYNSLLYGIIITFGAFPFPIVLALMVNELRQRHFKKIVQTVSYMPHFLSWMSVVGIFYGFFALEGPFNQLMSAIFGDSYEATNILMDSKNFLPVLFGTHLWKQIGWSSIIFLAAIVGIDTSLYEAASMDGCGKLKQVWYVTLPSIKGTIVVVLVMSLGGIVTTNFEQVYGFQNVFTQEATETINTLIYRQGIQNGQYSLATAFGLAQGLVTITLITISNLLSKKFLKTSIW